jgi:hypothetical protein
MAQKRDGETSAERGGFQPLKQGYSPQPQRGHVPNAKGTHLPKAPASKTGASRPNGKA